MTANREIHHRRWGCRCVIAHLGALHVQDSTRRCDNCRVRYVAYVATLTSHTARNVTSRLQFLTVPCDSEHRCFSPPPSLFCPSSSDYSQDRNCLCPESVWRRLDEPPGSMPGCVTRQLDGSPKQYADGNCRLPPNFRSVRRHFSVVQRRAARWSGRIVDPSTSGEGPVPLGSMLPGRIPSLPEASPADSGGQVIGG